MPATDPEISSMEDPHTVEDEKGSLTDVPSSAPPMNTPVSSSPLRSTVSNFSDEAAVENRAVSIASNDCTSDLPSPAEASPANPAVTPHKKGTLTDVPSSAPPMNTPLSSSPLRSTVSNFTDEAVVENRAVSIASNDCTSDLPSPAEASPANPAVTPHKKGTLTDVPSSAPPMTTPLSSSPLRSTVSNFTDEAVVENRAVSIASNDCTSDLPSPAEASPANPAVTPHKKGTLTDVPSSAPPMNTPLSSSPLCSTVTNFTDEAVVENRAVSIASNDCASALSSPAKASPANTAVTQPSTFEGTVETSPDTSHLASASDSLKGPGTGLVTIMVPPPLLTAMPFNTFGSANKMEKENDFPASLTLNGVTVTLENNSVWKQFHSCGTEMILTKQGRRMFPYCRYRLSGLEPECYYKLVLSIVPFDQFKYRWNRFQWEVCAVADIQTQGQIRAFSHQHSPCKGSEWLSGWVSFYKLKLTNNYLDRDDHIILQSMQRYIPRLHVIPVPDGVVTMPEAPVVMGPESMTFIFPQTEFMAVTTYQNFRITQLKINHNPFAKGFREDLRLNRVIGESQPLVKIDMLSSVSQQHESKEGIVDLSSKNHTIPAPASNVQVTRLVLKPIMSTHSSKDERYVPCIRGKHALGELVLVEKHPLGESVEESLNVSVTLQLQQGLELMPKATSVTPTTSKSSPGSSPANRKGRKKINRRGKNCGTAVSPKQISTSSPTVSSQPELDHVEGLLFASFPSKEALEVHTGNKPANSPASASPVSPATSQQAKESVELVPETDEEKISHMEAVLLQDLRALKHRQVIHPVLQEVGLKLSSLNTGMSVDLQYLGVDLQLNPTNLPEEVNSTTPPLADHGLPFISRTGKTSDVTKIKGWKNKFIQSKEISPKCNGLQKNLSAFCSDMLDEYLESEAQQISERAEAFSTNAEGSVAYQLPAKGSSYVKTLDSVLKHRSAASNSPCPTSQKPLLCSALTSQAPTSHTSLLTPVKAEAQAVHESVSGSGHSTAVSQRSPTYQPLVSQRPALNPKPPDPPRVQLKMMNMEREALSQGLRRTQLTPGRLTVALSVILSKDMVYRQATKLPLKLKPNALGPKCGQEFCRLGCVCSSLQLISKGPPHCRQPECMFGCDCFKRKISEQLSAEESNQSILSVFSMINRAHAAHPHQSSHTKQLWKRNINDVDAEPLFIPKEPQCLVPEKAQKRRSANHPSQLIQEEDKDPVYKYLESFLTCARVREFNSKPPPPVTIEPKILDTVAVNAVTKQNTTTDNVPKQAHRTMTAPKNPAETSRVSASETEARKQIQIQSDCRWDKDHKMILKALCQRMSQNRLSEPFQIGPYHIHPVSKIFIRKPSGSIVIYRIRISKPSKTSRDEFEDSDEERLDLKEEDGQSEESDMQVGVLPFRGGVLPAGILRARTKALGLQASDLVQVNGKPYSQARLLLGGMGSLHPANRIAAYLTGRLHAPADVRHRDSKKLHYTQKPNTPAIPHVKVAGTSILPNITAKKTPDLKTLMQPPQAHFHLNSWRKGPIGLSKCSQSTSSVNPVQPSTLSQCSAAKPLQNSSTSSPVLLTVSPSLKTPSFLGQNGTYSFRICPPANKSTTGQNPPGLVLPGGFTLLKLPKPETNEAARPSETGNTRNSAALFNVEQVKLALDTNWLGLDSLLGDDDVRSTEPEEPCPSPTKTSDEKKPSVEADEADIRQMDTHLGSSSEGESSDSDYCGEGDEDDELVDIETVEHRGEEAAVGTTDKTNSGNAGDQDSAMDLTIQADDIDRQRQHSLVERQRRSDMRNRFDKLQVLLKCDLKANRLHILAMTLREIQNLGQTSKFLEEQKNKLTRVNSVYINQLSHLSGKSETVISQKLNAICEKQKVREKTMKWSPFFSKLLQSRAALLQSSTPESESQDMYQSQSNLFKPPYQPNSFTAAAKERLRQMMIQLRANPQTSQTTADKPKPAPPIHPQAASFKTPAEVTAAPLEVVNQPPGAPVNCTIPSPQTPVTSGTVTIPVTLTLNADSQISPSLTPSGHNAPQLSLPLIRSKTGRIILPSFLNPASKTVYSFTFVRSNQADGDGESSTSANTHPSDVDSNPSGSQSSQENQENPIGSESNQENQEKPSSSESSQENQENQEKPSSSESNQENQENQEKPPSSESNQENQEKPSSSESILKEDTIPSLKSELKCKQSPLPALDNSIHVPLKAEQVLDSSQERSTVQGLSFKPMRPVYVSVNAVRCDTGGSLNNRVVPAVSEKTTQHSSEETVRAADAPAPGRGSDVSDCPVPVKRGRGRPKKLKPPESPSSSRSKDDVPVRLPVHIETRIMSSQANTSRPLTRGALGKDFPSAKKRSWIDVEKELEHEGDI
ncbi:MAX gene-associated protein isoform X2 [Solea solea]|uniref:MAX gene-associated protein isoform X2 n=1 Tax=Solea solea TaxID=90069 RepID=UPI002729E5BB|nr:MAX gene-associated protein isoform X2 [Solea solea]